MKPAFVALFFGAFLLAGSSAESAPNEAVAACGPAKYSEALAHYKNAVAWSKERDAKGVCDTENGYLESIADEASRAVTACGEFRNTIRTSAGAEPIRKALAPSLTLRSLTGELLVIKDSKFQNWIGAEQLFERDVSFWAHADGAYGPGVIVSFRANGQATWGELQVNALNDDIMMVTERATYAIMKSSEQAKRTIIVKHGGKTSTYVLGVDSVTRSTSTKDNPAPVFTLTPTGADATKEKTLYSLHSECDA